MPDLVPLFVAFTSLPAAHLVALIAIGCLALAGFCIYAILLIAKKH
ncbi:hypothetical protein [Mesorhizobium sp. L-8-10]|nr:hypothetical protein [Mesorhizobium sp. L-8-10]